MLVLKVPVLVLKVPVLVFNVPVLVFNVPVLVFNVPVLVMNVPAKKGWPKNSLRPLTCICLDSIHDVFVQLNLPFKSFVTTLLYFRGTFFAI